MKIEAMSKKEQTEVLESRGYRGESKWHQTLEVLKRDGGVRIHFDSRLVACAERAKLNVFLGSHLPRGSWKTMTTPKGELRVVLKPEKLPE